MQAPELRIPTDLSLSLLPPDQTGYCTWQFNFKFNINTDMFAQDSIDLLKNSGIQFDKHEEDGIDPYDFAELLMTSVIVLNDNVKWISFHSGYDFGYLLKILTDQNLLSEESEFFDMLKIYFPCTYDVKYLMKSCKNLKGGLQEVSFLFSLLSSCPFPQRILNLISFSLSLSLSLSSAPPRLLIN